MSIPTKQRGREETYDPALKIAVARDYLTSSLGFTKLAKKYNLPGESTARHFVRWYRRMYPDGIVAGIPEKPKQNALPADIQEANLKITALEMLIANAGKELGIDLVKKFGTKQQGK